LIQNYSLSVRMPTHVEYLPITRIMYSVSLLYSSGRKQLFLCTLQRVPSFILFHECATETNSHTYSCLSFGLIRAGSASNGLPGRQFTPIKASVLEGFICQQYEIRHEKCSLYPAHFCLVFNLGIQSEVRSSECDKREHNLLLQYILNSLRATLETS
jgi:hypothetical protein